MDRNGKKSKAAVTSTNGERSDLKSKSRDPLGRIMEAARSAPGARDEPQRDTGSKGPRRG